MRRVCALPAGPRRGMYRSPLCGPGLKRVPAASGWAVCVLPGAWPLPGRYKISSLFGSRIDPINGRRDNISGADGDTLDCETR